MNKVRVGRKEFESGKKRVNIALDIRDFDDLCVVSEYNNIPPTTMVCSWTAQRARTEAKAILKSGYIPMEQRGENLFSVDQLKTKDKKTKGDKRG